MYEAAAGASRPLCLLTQDNLLNPPQILFDPASLPAGGEAHDTLIITSDAGDVALPLRAIAPRPRLRLSAAAAPAGADAAGSATSSAAVASSGGSSGGGSGGCTNRGTASGGVCCSRDSDRPWG